MFKKSLAAVAVLGAFAATSFAADVTLYGKVDMGVQYQNEEFNGFDGVEYNKDKFTLDSGVGQASRIGLKATEDLGNGYKVSFKLEKGFKVDGTSEDADQFFDRESSLSLSSGWGTLMAGRFGSFSAASSDTDIVMSRVESFDGGHTGAELVMFGKMDNSIAYFSPKFAGFQAAAMYSLKSDATEEAQREGHRDADRYAGVALTYDIGALQTALSYEVQMRTTTSKMDDAKLITFGGNYDFDLFKLYAAGQYFTGFDSAIASSDMITSAGETLGKTGEALKTYNPLGQGGIEGYALHVGTNFDALGGHFGTAVYYVDASAEIQGHQDVDGQYFGVAGRYIYDLSKRTNIRTTLAYNQKTWDKFSGEKAFKDDFEKNTYVAKVSLTHNF